MKKFITHRRTPLLHALDRYYRAYKRLTNEQVHGVDDGIHEKTKTL